MFNERLKMARKSKRLKGREVAELLGVSYSTYSKYESTERKPDIEMLARIADVLCVTTDYLLGRTDDPKIHVIENPKQLEPLGVTEVRTTGTEPFTDEQLEASGAGRGFSLIG